MFARAIRLRNVDRFQIEHLHTIQSLKTATAAVIFAGQPATRAPRNGIYRHHSNEGSPQGYGPNQIVSLSDSYIYDLWSDGGTTLRMETDGNASGVHRVFVQDVYGQNGNRVAVLMPTLASSDDVRIFNVRGVSMYEGVRIGAPREGTNHTLTNVTVQGGCIVAGTQAQEQVPNEECPDPSPRQTSRAVTWDKSNQTPPFDTSGFSGIGYDEPGEDPEEISFLCDPLLPPPQPGVDPTVECNEDLARNGLLPPMDPETAFLVPPTDPARRASRAETVCGNGRLSLSPGRP
jgi:hypothetical protein